MKQTLKDFQYNGAEGALRQADGSGEGRKIAAVTEVQRWRDQDFLPLGDGCGNFRGNDNIGQQTEIGVLLGCTGDEDNAIIVFEILLDIHPIHIFKSHNYPLWLNRADRSMLFLCTGRIVYSKQLYSENHFG